MERAGKTILLPLESELLQLSVVAVEEKSENGNAGSGGEDESLMVKRKRGRPRKQQGADLSEFSENPMKRGRLRGPGKGQTLASLGCAIGNTAGTDFTPYIISIQKGENIAQRIWSFSNMTPDSVCILSANGTISTAEIFVPASPQRIITYKDEFSIIHLNGSHTYDEKRGGKLCLLSVQLADKEGRFYGGAVAGALIAGGPTQIIIATFRERVIRPQKVRIVVPAQVEVEAEADVGCASPPSPPPPLYVDWREFGPLVESEFERAT